MANAGPGLLLHDAVSALPFFEMDTLPAGQVTEAIASPWLQTRLHSPSHLSCLTTCRPVDAAGPAAPGAPCSCAKACQLQPHEREGAFMNLKLIVAEISEAATLMTALIPPPHAT
jgi:hypothetical protein